ncbi:MAG: hypothetical protein CVU33_12705 [Betaproteobacteria bacterium HGW-Betaproteobacteria-6]|jgi:hypothetical protein|nr:MAG: hypothetical protein CVU33_12705 [Betaproteobacteria bacterium HGW-Betaproteobacteria-6]
MGKIVLISLLALVGALFWRNWSRQRRGAYIAAFPYQRILDKRLAARRPELSAEQRGEVFAALDDYFQLCHKAGRRMVAMPSQAVDDAWHEFILFTRQYDKFCRHAFGRFLHHTPAEAMSTPTQASDGLKRAWRLACAHEKINPKSPARLPRLFALDAALGIAGGFVYHLDCLAASGGAAGTGYCASHIGCGGSGCSGDSGSSDSGGDGGGCGGGCGGD